MRISDWSSDVWSSDLADQVLGTDEAVQPAVSYQDADRFLQTQADVLKSRAMAERVAQALGLFADTSFFDKMALSPPDPEPGIARDKQLRDAVIEAILDNLSGTLPRDSRVITIAFTRSEEHTSELQSLMRISYAVFCLKKKKIITHRKRPNQKQTTYRLI